MKGNSTRKTFRKKKHYRKVNTQQGRVRVLDFGVQKIERALAGAQQNKIIALREIAEVETKANQALALLSDCPKPDLGARNYAPLMPHFGVLMGPSDSPYRPERLGASCDHYPGNAEIAEDNTTRHLDYTKRIRSEAYRVHNYINTLCSSTGLDDSRKFSLQNTLSSLINYAQAETDEFDRFIDDIEKFLEEYKECIRKRQ